MSYVVTTMHYKTKSYQEKPCALDTAIECKMTKNIICFDEYQQLLTKRRTDYIVTYVVNRRANVRFECQRSSIRTDEVKFIWICSTWFFSHTNHTTLTMMNFIAQDILTIVMCLVYDTIWLSCNNKRDINASMYCIVSVRLELYG
jgi:hypothetical protein